MNIKIQRLELTNFKCFKHKEITFDSDVTTIRGRNGVGKTTIADAILWCLFGKNSQGQSDFDLKTHDENGKPIPNLDHSVEMVLHIDTILEDKEFEKDITIKRTIKETWIKKRGSEEQVFKNNTTEYMVNGEVKTAADYKKFISELVGEDIFRAITNPSYFPSLKWQEQRNFLSRLAGDISSADILGNDKDLQTFSSELTEDIIAYRKHLSYQIKQIKDKLDKIPVRLEEQNKALPESLDYEAIQMELDNAHKQLEEINQKIITIKSGNGGDVLRAEIRVEIENIRRDMNAIEDKERINYRTRQQEHDNKVSELSRQFNQLVTTQRDLEASIPSFDKMIERCKETLDQCEKDAQAIRDEWTHNLSRTFHFHERDGVCPTCGQYLPEEQVAEKRKKAEENLNADKARIKQELTEKAEKVKTTRADAEGQIKDIEAKKSEAEKNLADIKEQLNKIFSDKQKAEKEPVVSYEEALAECKEYQELILNRDELRKKLDSVGIDEDSEKQLADLEARKRLLESDLRDTNNLLATRTQYDKIMALIEGIQEEKQDLVRQLSELERKEDVAARYQQRQNQILEERINQHFSLVQWRMFRTVNNGGDPFDEPYCECYVDGVAYHDGLNQAARLNAGLDVINALCRHYNVSAPIVIDNSESNLNILSTESQQLRLEVFDSELQIV